MAIKNEYKIHDLFNESTTWVYLKNTCIEIGANVTVVTNTLIGFKALSTRQAKVALHLRLNTLWTKENTYYYYYYYSTKEQQ